MTAWAHQCAEFRGKSTWTPSRPVLPTNNQVNRIVCMLKACCSHDCSKLHALRHCARWVSLQKITCYSGPCWVMFLEYNPRLCYNGPLDQQCWHAMFVGRPCCPANLFFSRPIVPEEKDLPCVQRLSQKELCCLRRFFERRHPIFAAPLPAADPTPKPLARWDLRWGGIGAEGMGCSLIITGLPTKMGPFLLERAPTSQESL